MDRTPGTTGLNPRSTSDYWRKRCRRRASGNLGYAGYGLQVVRAGVVAVKAEQFQRAIEPPKRVLRSVGGVDDALGTQTVREIDGGACDQGAAQCRADRMQPQLGGLSFDLPVPRTPRLTRLVGD